jgi:MarR family transcriptional regulator, transcriptional regulator for hemolysin
MPKKSNPNLGTTDTVDIEYLVCHLGLLWRRLLNAKIKSLGVSGTEKRVLFCIAHNPGFTQVQIASLLDLEPQNLMRSLDKLEKLNWIQKQNDPDDRRIKCLTITTSAHKIIVKIKKLSDNIKPQILAGLDDKNIQVVISQLAKMRENISIQLAEEEKKTNS